MSDIYANAVDSLRIGIEHFLKEPGYSSRKHAIFDEKLDCPDSIFVGSHELPLGSPILRVSTVDQDGMGLSTTMKFL